LSLFTILIEIYKIISYISTFLNNRTNHNKIYMILISNLNKTNDQT
jgi:hypothetical protein